jgi:high affinity sulfate transporter 1
MLGNLGQLALYKKRWLSKDLLAGLTVAAVTIPVCMGYAQIAGLPPVYGLYAAVIPSIAYVLFASSKRVMFGTDAVIVSMIGAGLAAAAVDDPSKLPVLASLCALIIGGIFFVFGVLKVGVIARYLSKPTMAGFISGLAVTILVTQLPKITEVSVDDAGTFSEFWQILTSLGGANWYSFTAGILTILLLLLAKKWSSKFPATIAVLILFTAATGIFGLADQGMGIVGHVPSGLAGFDIPWVGWQEFTYLLTVCFATAIVVFADTLLTARSFALKYKDEFRENKELRAVGIANMVGGLFGAMPGSGSASRGAAAQAAGMRTQAAQLFAATSIAVVLIFGSSLLYYMPTSVLAAIVIVAVVSLIDYKLLTHLFRTRRQEFWVMTITALAVIILGVLPGVLISVAMSMADFFLRASRPPEAVLGKVPNRRGYYDLKNHAEARAVPGVVIYRFGAPLFYANHADFESRVLELADEEDVRAIVVAGEAITDIDTTAADGLRDLAQKLKGKRVDLYFAGLIEQSRIQLENYDVGIPNSHFHKTIDRVLEEIKT